MSRDSTAPKAFGKGGAPRRQVRGRERGALAPFFRKVPLPQPPSMPSYKSHALAVAVAGDALNGGVPTQLVHLILGEFQFVEIVVALERTAPVPASSSAVALFSSKRFSTSCRLGSALNALEGITAQNEKANKAAHTKDISFFMMKLRRIMSQCKMPVEGKIAYECKARMGFL